MISIYLQAGLLVFAMVTALWLVSLAVQDSSIVDPFWGLGFSILAWFYLWQVGGELRAGGGLIAAVLSTVWGGRLALHLTRRNWGQGEDYRYQRWRQAAGDKWWWQSYFKVFILQGALMWLISAPLLAAQGSRSTAGPPALLGLAVIVWAIGFVFESVADLQLARFKANRSSQEDVLQSGLWRYSRHPNYFGDALQWWGLYLLATAAGGWLTIFSPLLMTILLLRISGVSLLERDLKAEKPDYAEYVRRTSAFFPLPPRNGSNQENGGS